MPPSADERIRRLAAGQHGVVTRAQLLEAGLTRRQIDRRLERGRLRPLHRGVYLLGALQGSLRPPHAHDMAAVLACGPHALLSHRSAARLWGLLPRAGKRIELTTAIHVRRQRPGLRIHRSGTLTPADRAIRYGIPTTSPARTLRDLSSLLDTDALSRVLARAEREGLIDDDGAARLLARQAGRPGAPQLRAVAGRPFTRSEAERKFLELVRSGGLPAPAVNAVVMGLEVDFLWSDQRLIVEVDGFRYHGSRPAFENDRRRDRSLVAGGYHVVRLTWRQIVHEPRPTLVAVARVLDRPTPGTPAEADR